MTLHVPEGAKLNTACPCCGQVFSYDPNEIQAEWMHHQCPTCGKRFRLHVKSGESRELSWSMLFFQWIMEHVCLLDDTAHGPLDWVSCRIQEWLHISRYILAIPWVVMGLAILLWFSLFNILWILILTPILRWLWWKSKQDEEADTGEAINLEDLLISTMIKGFRQGILLTILVFLPSVLISAEYVIGYVTIWIGLHFASGTVVPPRKRKVLNLVPQPAHVRS